MDGCERWVYEKNTKKKPDITVIQNRYFSVNDLRRCLQELEIGLDYVEFKRLWYEEVVCPPDVIEPYYIAWEYDNAVTLIQQVYALKGKTDEYDIYQIDSALNKRKELQWWKKRNASAFTGAVRAKRARLKREEKAQIEEQRRQAKINKQQKLKEKKRRERARKVGL